MRPVSRFNAVRTLATVTQGSSSSSSSSAPAASLPHKTSSESLETTSTIQATQNAPNTHFKITLRRSAISLGDKIKGTLKALGIHRRFQTVYFPFSPEVAGKILRVKELVEVENVPAHLVMTKQEQRQARRPPRGYKVVGTRKGKFMNV
ncbi:hypothetical protein CVT26_001605 [Gymnopilus dilepis]|uniref:Large ribosomal subunit protein uL30m n=1 Tax=Gymnopilus dilepis TaxID=231916 RepID=A0A409VSW4_9AGAR|nr:hypothetical protein CVT26_001605 [Gymnopilus dilepis]